MTGVDSDCARETKSEKAVCYQAETFRVLTKTCHNSKVEMNTDLSLSLCLPRIKMDTVGLTSVSTRDGDTLISIRARSTTIDGYCDLFWMEEKEKEEKGEGKEEGKEKGVGIEKLGT